MKEYYVGQQLRRWNTLNPEGLHYNYVADTHTIMFMLRDLQDKEIDDFKYAPAEFAFRVDECLITLVIRIGSLRGNAHYNWWNVPDERRTVPGMELDYEQRPLVNLMLIEHKTGTIKALRTLTWSPAFSRRIEEEIRRQAAHPEYSDKSWHLIVMNQLCDRYQDDPMDMKDHILAECLGGD